MKKHIIIFVITFIFIFLFSGCKNDEVIEDISWEDQKELSTDNQEVSTLVNENSNENLKETDDVNSQDNPQDVNEENTQGNLQEDNKQMPDIITVHVCGEVANPGIYELPGGSRINAAVEKAGGFTEKADKEWVNLALELTDSQQVYIPNVSETENQELVAKEENAPENENVKQEQPGETKVNINTADANELMTLSGIGESKADSIITYRNDNGPFSKIEDLMNITGIKEGVFNKIKDKITVN